MVFLATEGNALIFYKQPVYKQLALTTLFLKQLLGLNDLPNNKQQYKITNKRKNFYHINK